MAKRKQRAKRNKKKKQAAAESFSAADLRSRIAAMIDGGRGRAAVGHARTLQSHPDCLAEDLRLCSQAIACRIEELLRDNHCKEAVDMADAQRRTDPDFDAALPPPVRLHLACAGGGPGFWRAYDADSAFRAEVDDLIRQRLLDPRCLLAIREPEGQSLAIEARALMAAWDEVESRACGAAFDALKSTIGRKSPLLHWRLFVQALDALYAGDPDLLEANAGRIPDGSALASAAAELRRLASGGSLATKAGAAVRRQFASSDDQALRDLAKDRRGDVAVKVYKSLVGDGRPALAHTVVACWLWGQGDQPDYVRSRCVLRVSPHLAQSERMLALVVTIDQCDDEYEWEIIQAASMGSPMRRAVGLRWLAEKLQTLEGAESDVESRFRQSVEAMPLAATYMRWHTWLLDEYGGDRDAPVSEETAKSELRLLADWEQDFPDDPTPIYRSIAAYRRQEKYAVAFDLLRDQEARLTPNQFRELYDPIVINWLIFGRNGFPRDLWRELVERYPTGSLRHAISLQAGCRFGTSAAERRTCEKTLGDLQNPLVALVAASLLNGRTKFRELPGAVKAQLKTPELLEKGVATLLLPENADVPYLHGTMDLLEGAFRKQSGSTMVRLLEQTFEILRNDDSVPVRLLSNLVVFDCLRRGRSLGPVALAARVYWARRLNKSDTGALAAMIRRGAETVVAAALQLATDKNPHRDLLDRIVRATDLEPASDVSTAEAKRILAAQKKVFSLDEISDSLIKLATGGAGLRDVIEHLNQFDPDDFAEALDTIIDDMLAYGDDEQVAPRLPPPAKKKPRPGPKKPPPIDDPNQPTLPWDEPLF